MIRTMERLLLGGALLVLCVVVSQFRVAMSQGLASKRCEFMNTSVAICTEKFLISAQLDGLPWRLRVLSLDRNQISVLENNVFEVRHACMVLTCAYICVDKIIRATVN